MIKRVCAYGRVSTKHEEQESSLLTQREMFNKWIDAHSDEGYKLVDEVYEKRSGTLITKRPKFMQMIEDAKQGKYDTLLFKDSKRFSRNAEDFLNIVEDLKRSNVNIIFITEGLDSSKEKDRTMLSILGMMAENYSNALHNNLQNSLRIKCESDLGRIPGNLFGYKRVKGDSSKADIVPEQAEILKELFNRYADGEGIASITQDFIDRDIRNYRGNKMSMFALRRFIRNPLYKGVLIMNKTNTVDVRTTKRVSNDESLWITRYRPDLQIIDTELWEKCNSIMDANKQKMDDYTNGQIGTKPNILTNKLFSKVVVCGCCGRNYNRKDSHHSNIDKRYTYLMCNYKKYSKKNQANIDICTNENVIRLDYLIEIVNRVILAILNNSEGLEDQVQNKIASILKERNKSDDNKLAEQQLKEAREKQKRVAILFKDGLVDEDEYREIRNQVKELESKAKMSRVGQISEEDIQRLTRKFIGNLESIIKEEISDDSGIDVKAFNKLFDKIVIDKDRIDIIFRAFENRLEKIEVEGISENINVFSPVVDNNFSECQASVQKKIKRHSKAKWSCDRTSEFVYLADFGIKGKDTNQIIIGKRKLKIGVFFD